MFALCIQPSHFHVTQSTVLWEPCLSVLFTMAKASNSAPPWTLGRPQTCVFYGLSRFSASAGSTLFSSSLCHLPSLCPFLSSFHHYTLTLDFISALKAPSSLFTGPWSDPRVLATVTTLKAKAPFPLYQTTPPSSLVTQHLTQHLPSKPEMLCGQNLIPYWPLTSLKINVVVLIFRSALGLVIFSGLDQSAWLCYVVCKKQQ